MDNIGAVTEKRRCMSCGACSSVCPTGAISIKYKEQEGFYRPAIENTKCIGCGKCMKICPAVNQKKTDLMGVFRGLYLAHSTDVNIRHWATSGGVINALVRYLLDKNIVEGVLMTTYCADSPIEAQAVMITCNNISVLEQNPRDFASRYVTVPVLNQMKEVKRMKSIAVVGTSCQTTALKLMGGTSDLNIFKIGITCSGGMSYKATTEYKRIQNQQFAKMFYRGDGWPGKNSLITTNGNIEYPHNGSLFERMFSSQIFKNPGCRACKDHFAENADISFCDFWNDKERASEHEGNSCVIVRSERAKEIFQKMQQDRYIETVRELSEVEVQNGQLHVLKVKKGKIHNTIKYKLFMEIVDFVFDHELYRGFRYNAYQCFCKIYRRMCKKADI